MRDLQRVWKEFEANEVSHSVAHYLLAIWDSSTKTQPPRAVDIARRLDVSRAAVSLQLRTLKDNGLVCVGKDHRLRLSTEGKELVRRILSKRRIIQSFLVEILAIDEDIAEADACKIEHLISGETGASLARFISFARHKRGRLDPLIREFHSMTLDCTPGISCDFCTRDCVLRDSSSTT